MEDRRMKVDRVHNILHKELEMKKLCARWVPQLLTIETHVKSISQQCLLMLKRNLLLDIALIFDRRRDLDPSIYTRIKTAVEAVDSAEEGEDCFVGREDNGYCFLRFPRNHLH